MIHFLKIVFVVWSVTGFVWAFVLAFYDGKSLRYIDRLSIPSVLSIGPVWWVVFLCLFFLNLCYDIGSRFR